MSVRATMSTVTDFTTSLYAALASIILSMSFPTLCASSLNLFDTTGRSPSARSVSSGVIGRQSLVISSIVAKGSILSPPIQRLSQLSQQSPLLCLFHLLQYCVLLQIRLTRLLSFVL